MSFRIIKRDGREVEYNKKKITDAIYKAAKATENFSKEEALNEVALPTAKKVGELLKVMGREKKNIDVETVQDLIEVELMERGYFSIAKNYILYRKRHEKYRDAKKLYSGINDTINNYLDLSSWKVNENSNMGYSLQGLNNHIASEVTGHYWLNEIYPEHIKEKHINGDFHIHDLANLSNYCCGWDLQDLLLEGFSGVSTKTESAPPKHFRTALGQMVNFLYTLQGESSGAQAFSSFDTYLAPFVAYDDLNYNEVYQAMQEFIFNLNVPTRVGFQSPFTNLTMDLVCPSNMAEDPSIIGGKMHYDMPLKRFQKEMDMINKAFAEVMLAGDSKGRVFSFPIPTYNITEDFDWDNEVLNPVWEMTAKYGIPYFANFVNSDMKAEDARSMCCRLRLDNRQLRKRGGGLFGSSPMTGSIGVVTLNMPRIGLLAKDDEDYLNRVYELMDIAKESLEIKRRVLEELTDAGLYPYSKFYLRSIKERFGEYWKNHFNTIGLNGMNESVLNFLGKDMTENKSIKFTKWVMHKMKERMVEYQEETSDLFNLEATPAEGTSYRLAKLDLDKYGKEDAFFANDKRVFTEDADPYYTNSTQLPVGATDDPFEALDWQDELQKNYTGGTVLHLFLGERMPSIESTKKFVKRVAENYELPYYSITPTFSICPVHGYLPGEHKYCPKCDAENGYEGE